jgi:TolB-like protein/DNA-binding winged helix-turn-helix (wHTH) protein
MGETGRAEQTTKFGIFEVDLRSGELRKSGSRIKLQEQPFKVLQALLERPGEVVTRDELRRRIWPDENFGDFDHAVNVAITKLRAALGDSAESPHLIETLHRRGYRFIFPVDVVAPQGLQSSVAGMESVAESAPLRRKLRIAGLGAVCVLGFLFILNVGRWREYLSLRGTNPHIQSLAVLPLANLSHDPAQAYFTDGMTDELITELSKVGALRVISLTSAMHYRETSKTLPEIARELNVDAVVEGSVVRFGNQVKIGAKLVDARNDRQLWAESYQRELKDVLALQGEIARDIANQEQRRATSSSRIPCVRQ